MTQGDWLKFLSYLGKRSLREFQTQQQHCLFQP